MKIPSPQTGSSLPRRQKSATARLLQLSQPHSIPKSQPTPILIQSKHGQEQRRQPQQSKERTQSNGRAERKEREAARQKEEEEELAKQQATRRKQEDRRIFSKLQREVRDACVGCNGNASDPIKYATLCRPLRITYRFDSPNVGDDQSAR
jgi:hypothetical protein